MTLRLDWPANDPAELVTAYQVWEDNEGLINLIATTPNNFWEFAPPSGMRTWWIKAVNFVGTSASSPTVSTPTAPSAPGQPTLTVIP